MFNLSRLKYTDIPTKLFTQDPMMVSPVSSTPAIRTLRTPSGSDVTVTGNWSRHSQISKTTTKGDRRNSEMPGILVDRVVPHQQGFMSNKVCDKIYVTTAV